MECSLQRKERDVMGKQTCHMDLKQPKKILENLRALVHRLPPREVVLAELNLGAFSNIVISSTSHLFLSF